VTLSALFLYLAGFGSLQKPKVFRVNVVNTRAVEVRHHLGNHFGVFDCYRQILLFDGLPINAAELIYLVYEVVDGLRVNVLC
jgi:hypothetical protein